MHYAKFSKCARFESSQNLTRSTSRVSCCSPNRIVRAPWHRYHPDNMARQPDLTLPEQPKGPEPMAKITELDKQKGMWGHQLCCEKAFGPGETTLRIKDQVTAKVGGKWNTQFESGGSNMKSGVYGGTLRVVSMEEQVELAGGKSPFL